MPKHVLIVEDNATDVSVLQSLLKRLGVSYTVFFDGRVVPDVLPDMPVPDAIFLDLELPGVTGYDILQAIQTMPDYQDVPVVAYTSHLSEMSAARDAGFHSFLGKPLKLAQFSAQLENIFNSHPVWDGRDR